MWTEDLFEAVQFARSLSSLRALGIGAMDLFLNCGKPNKSTGANAGGRPQLRMRTRWAARVAQFPRSATGDGFLINNYD